MNHQEQFVLAELGRLYVDCRALVVQLEAANKRIVELESAARAQPVPVPDANAV